MTYSDALKAHLASGSSTVARAWAVTRSDGEVLGFTDHDRALEFAGIRFAPESGMTAKALAQGTGLAVDNSEVYGALSSEAITEADILAGRYDGAELWAWIVNWAEPDEHALIFRGSLGELTRQEGAFTAELRGLAEALSVERGRVYHPRCAAVLGDGACRFDLAQPGFTFEGPVARTRDRVVFELVAVAGFQPRWFEKGRFRVLSGEAAGLVGLIKGDHLFGAEGREIELWQAIGAPVVAGDLVRLEAGCDKRAVTCREKFSNFINFRGFPHVPGEDWLVSYPVQGGAHDGGSLFS
ncbi:hypothetical protein DL1_01280 [Thioclava dalianensis]|uniref:Bacteriophage phiJL001 Gp84 C-terminal domain-containing protein n=1 Tax=Thioclava dalianensis TaxID=1185766 RepID=A0A074TIY3_9RHOB|nr:DUF2163 domain-containing protein [Thioclava dalianensis]KEP71666.1 hypothetical protein DL1_01280 [Thioclava dalianensis]SFN41600.1 phage conserved hypothetical protein BR0599 [Thioclava dalianensis]